VQGSAVAVLSTLDHSTSYISPVGQDVSANDMFDYAGLMIMADQDNTKVVVNPGGGVAATTNVINRGYGGAWQVNGGIMKGATVTADKPIQVDLITGDTSATYESRSFLLRPVDLFASEYFMPVGTESAAYPSRAFLFNTNTTAITVSYTNMSSSGTLSVPAPTACCSIRCR